MDVAIVPILSTHRVWVVAGGHVAPVRNQLAVVGGEDLVAESVDAIHGGPLHSIGKPG